MVKFEELKNNTIFSVNAWEMNQIFQNKSFGFDACVANKSFLFIKNSDKTCKELHTGVQFTYDGSRMINYEYGLYFFATYVNEKPIKNHADEKYTIGYFEIARTLNNQTEKKILKK